MDFTQNDFRNWMEELFCPTILVRTTEDVEQMCLKNNLNFIDLLRPYERVKKDIYAKTTGTYENMLLKNFRVRFRTLEQLSPPPRSSTTAPDVEKLTLYDKFLESMVRDSYDPKDKNVQIPTILNRKSVNLLDRRKNYTPWFNKLREELMLSIRCSSHECLEHPVACLCVTSTSNPDPVKALKSMYDANHPHMLFKTNNVDTDVFLFYVLLQDSSNQDQVKVNQVFGKMKELFGASCCRLLTINSRDPNGNEKLIEDMWTSCIPRFDLFQKTNRKFGELLSKMDMEYVGMAVDQLISSVVLHIERKIRQIVTTNQSKKKGLFSTFWRKKRSKDEEMDIRRLADYSFLLHDYESALSNYKQIAPDLRTNAKSSTDKRDLMAYASVMEMIGICLLLMNGTKQEIDKSFNVAYKYYRLAKENIYALRAAILHAHAFKVQGDLRMAAEVFKKASAIEDRNFLNAALLFEQAAFCYIFMNPSQFRKFALFLVLSGYRFSHARQIRHSFRCYVTAINVYEHHGWSQIDEHMSITMARLCNYLGDLDASVRHMHEFMKKCKQMPEKQRAFLQEFLATVNNYLKPGDKKDELDFLALPRIDDKSVRVLLNDYGRYTHTDELPTKRWRDMEESIVRSMYKPNYTFKWEQGYFRKSKFSPCVVREPILVELELVNPLAVTFDVNDIHLLATFKPKNPSKNSEEPSFVAEPQSVQLLPWQTKTIRLRIIALEEGELIITGVKWSLENVVKGVKIFHIKGKRLNDTKKQRCGREYAEDTRLYVQATPSMPLLNIKLPEFPSSLWKGELKKVTMEIVNVGKVGMKNLSVKISHPKFVAFGSDANLSLDGETITENNTCVFSEFDESLAKDLSIVKLNVSLSPGESVKLPVVVRGARTGTHPIKLLFYYESEIENPQMPFRLYKFDSTLKVEEALDVYSFSQPTTNDSDTYIMGLNVRNKRAKETIELKQITAISPMWTITPLNFDPSVEAHNNKYTAIPLESTTLFFSISKAKNDKKQQSDQKTILAHTTHSLQSKTARDTRKFPYLEMLVRDCLLFSGLTPYRTRQQEILQQAKNPLATKQQLNQKNDEPDFPFLESHGLSLIIYWKTSDGQIFGQMHVLKVNFLPERLTKIHPHVASRFPGKENLQCPLRVTLQYDALVSHNFDEGSMCTVPIIFKVSNYSSDLKCTFSLKLLSERSNVSPFLWNGTTRLQVKDLQPGNSVNIPVSACFFTPGTYNLNLFELIAATETHPSLTLSFNELQFLINVTQSK